MALGRSPEYHWNQIISKSVHRLAEEVVYSFFLFMHGGLLFNGVERFEHFVDSRLRNIPV